MIGFETAALLVAGFAGGIGASRIYADRKAIWASLKAREEAVAGALVGSITVVAPKAAGKPIKRKPAKKGKGSVTVPFPRAKKPAAKKRKAA